MKVSEIVAYQLDQLMELKTLGLTRERWEDGIRELAREIEDKMADATDRRQYHKLFFNQHYQDKIVGQHRGYYLLKSSSNPDTPGYTATTEKCHNPLGTGVGYHTLQELKDALDAIPANPEPKDPNAIKKTFGAKLIGQNVQIVAFGSINPGDESILRSLPLPQYGITLVQYREVHAMPAA